MATIKSRKLKFLGHVMRRNGTENLAITGKMEGKRARGCQRQTYISNIKYRMGNSYANDVLMTGKGGKRLVVNALAQDT